MTMTQMFAWVMIVFGGLFTGAIFIVAIERVNLWQRMPVEQYAVDFRRSLYRLDPLIPILGLISMMGALAFAVGSQGRSAVFAWVGIAFICVIMIASIVRAEPMNSKFRKLPEGQAPEGIEQIRTAWRRFHWARTAVALGVLACFAAAIV
ncbi:DUF1772 domain-containing protein [Mycolicibacterium sp. lyk4-40-TYG-92]|uniref:DUF1772 domain-containing protein n=1 Tax=Mycolicibacterium sp. lyk4-40-TYG-92 TaxID=3040295 RepID=UPI0025511822|nr:DUF1772 domain-containing protein [Mycolicibacterium sp. lyk4-40-TYG-92]